MAVPSVATYAQPLNARLLDAHEQNKPAWQVLESPSTPRHQQSFGITFKFQGHLDLSSPDVVASAHGCVFSPPFSETCLQMRSGANIMSYREINLHSVSEFGFIVSSLMMLWSSKVHQRHHLISELP